MATRDWPARTALAWRRSGLSLGVAGIAIIRGIPTVASLPGRPLLGLAVLALAGVVFASSSRAAATRAHHPARMTADLDDLVPVALGTALVALAALLMVALVPS